ncbi:hypothetical protein EV356DRAFT_511019, partial [Viridothelium virens]
MKYPRADPLQAPKKHILCWGGTLLFVLGYWLRCRRNVHHCRVISSTPHTSSTVYP